MDWDFNAAPFEWVIYFPPKSRAFGHGSRVRGILRAWEHTKVFLGKFTTSSVLTSSELTCRPAGKWMPEAMAAARREQAIAAFGPPNSDDQENGAKWKLGPARIDDAVAFEASGPKPEEGRLDPSRLYVHFRFRWRPPWAGNGNEALGESGLGVQVSGQKVLFQPHFVFLASLDSTEFREQLTAFERDVPFKFDDNYFKRWAITPKRGNAGRILKAPTGWRKQWTVS